MVNTTFTVCQFLFWCVVDSVPGLNVFVNLLLTDLCGRVNHTNTTFTMSSEVEYYTKLAREMMHKRQDEDAINYFRKALKCVRNPSDTEAIKCRFNLGAALVALHRTSEGLKVLKKVLKLVIPHKDDRLLNGDLWYNLCLAHKDLDNSAEAVRCIQQAIECYSECLDAVALKANSACCLASLYMQLREFEKAAEEYAVAASSYGMANNVTQQAVCLFQQAQSLQHCSKDVDAVAAAEQCVKLCSEQSDAGVGKCA